MQRVALILRGQSSYVKKSFLKEAQEDYRDLTEDAIWRLVSVAAREGPDTGPARLVRRLAERLLTRKALKYLPIETGKECLLKEDLQRIGFKVQEDFAIISLKTTAYKEGGTPVFVAGWDGTCEDISEKSFTITTMKDRPEAESLLIVIDDRRQVKIERRAHDIKAVALASVRPS